MWSYVLCFAANTILCVMCYVFMCGQYRILCPVCPNLEYSVSFVLIIIFLQYLSCYEQDRARVRFLQSLQSHTLQFLIIHTGYRDSQILQIQLREFCRNYRLGSTSMLHQDQLSWSMAHNQNQQNHFWAIQIIVRRGVPLRVSPQPLSCPPASICGWRSSQLCPGSWHSNLSAEHYGYGYQAKLMLGDSQG